MYLYKVFVVVFCRWLIWGLTYWSTLEKSRTHVTSVAHASATFRRSRVIYEYTRERNLIMLVTFFSITSFSFTFLYIGNWWSMSCFLFFSVRIVTCTSVTRVSCDCISGRNMEPSQIPKSSTAEPEQTCRPAPPKNNCKKHLKNFV